MLSKKYIVCLAVVIFCVINFCSYAYAEESYIVKVKEPYVFGMAKGRQNIHNSFIKVDSEELANRYLAEGIAEYIEPNYEVELFTITNDTLCAEQQYLETISCYKAWELDTFGNDITIGVIDSGCYSHDDISNNLLDGYNYIDGSLDYDDDIGHGTHISGIIAAEVNDIGIAGIAGKSKIVPLKCFKSGTTTRISDIVEAMYDAVDKYDCQIVNMSWGLTNNSAALKEAVDYLYSNGVIMVAAVGNSGSSDVYYPAGYDEVIGVGSVSHSKQKSVFSQYNESVFVVAEGENVLSLGIDNDYVLKNGTSQSTPMVAAMAAILMNVNPKITLEEFKECIVNSSEDLGSLGYDIEYGHGLINIEKAMLYELKNQKCYISPINSCDENNSEILLYNNSESEISGVLIIVANSSLKQDEIKYINFSLNSDEYVKYLLNTSNTDAVLKGFVWESLDSMKPICIYHIL
jgi:subtilisin family serine protease